MPWQIQFLIITSAFGVSKLVEPLFPKWFSPVWLGAVIAGTVVVYLVLLTLKD